MMLHDNVFIFLSEIPWVVGYVADSERPSKSSVALKVSSG